MSTTTTPPVLPPPPPPAAAVCPKCGYEQPEGLPHCDRCGVIFARIPVAADTGLFDPVAHAMTIEVSAPPAPRFSAYDWKLLGGGLVAALLFYAFPLTRFLMSVFVTLLHEFGHALVAWILGCPAVPAFDMMYGGGVTYHQDFELPLAIFIGAGMAATGWWLRRRPRAVVALALVSIVWLFVVVSNWRREFAISIAGHGAEMLFAGIFLWMALSGVGWRQPELERPLGAFIAFYVPLHVLSFASSLRNDAAMLADYMGGKGGALMNDLEHVALDLRIYLGVETTVPEIAGWMLVLVPLPLVVALGLHGMRSRAQDALAWLFEEK